MIFLSCFIEIGKRRVGERVGAHPEAPPGALYGRQPPAQEEGVESDNAEAYMPHGTRWTEGLKQGRGQTIIKKEA